MNFIDFEKYNNIPDNLLEILIEQKNSREKKKLIDKHGNAIYSFLLFKLTLLEMPGETAKEIILKTNRARKKLESKLNCCIDFRVALLDFLIKNKDKYIKNPIIIEQALFLNLEKFTLIDELTGLRNFRYYNIRIKEELHLARRNSTPLSIIVFDLDNFKQLNDTYGHAEGNKVLKEIAEIIKNNIRKSDVAIRFGGDEFLIILPNTDKNGALQVGNKIRRAVRSQLLNYGITISGGVATYPEDMDDNDLNLFEIADKSLYYSKFQGKDKIMSFLLERRKENRIYLLNSDNIKVYFERPANLRNKHFTLLNISKNGMSIKSKTKIEPMSKLKGKIEKQELFFEFEGTVLWVQKELEDLYITGIRFTELKVNDIEPDEIAG